MRNHHVGGSMSEYHLTQSVSLIVNLRAKVGCSHQICETMIEIVFPNHITILHLAVSYIRAVPSEWYHQSGIISLRRKHL